MPAEMAAFENRDHATAESGGTDWPVKLELDKRSLLMNGLAGILPVMMPTILMTALLALAQPSDTPTDTDGFVPGTYRAFLHCPGGELPFVLEITGHEGNLTASIVNGSERIVIPDVTWRHDRLVLGIEHYDSTIEAERVAGGPTLHGKWKKRAGKDKWAELEFDAEPYQGYRFKPPGDVQFTQMMYPSVFGRWSVRFSESSDPAVGVFRALPDGAVEGTFLTTTGDYGYLAGTYAFGRLRLSGFDGAHAFLFDAQMSTDDTLAGDFWSRDTWHETWTATRADDAALPDGFGMIDQPRKASLSELRFRDQAGRMRSLGDSEFQGRALIIEVFGTWCPNCHDASRYLAELDGRYRDRGLRVVGLAFELTGDFERDAQQVRRFAERHGIEYPLLIAGVSDKGAVPEVLPFLDSFKAYPTSLFLRPDGTVHAVHAGFSGPATGSDYDELRRKFESTVEELLGRPD